MAATHVFSFTMVADFFKDAINQLQRGENAYKSGNVKTMVFDREVKPAVLKGTVSASMKKRMYSVEVSIDVDDDAILDVSCTCPRGLVKCHHIAALCIHAHHNISITDQACAWAAPRLPAAAEEIKTIAEIHPKPRQYTAICEEIPDINVENFVAKLGPGNVVGFSWLLRPESDADFENVLPSVEDIIFSNDYLETANKAEFLTEKLHLTQSQIDFVRENTVGQANNENWLIARKNRLTASNFGAVLNAVKRQRYPPSLYKKLVDGYDLSLAMAVQWGKEHEGVALRTFSASFKEMEVHPTGLWLDDSGFLGASPDGLCGDSAVIEVKCPYKYRDLSLSEALKHDKTYVIYEEEGKLVINDNHPYYHQIQGQLYITKRDLCYLVIWTPNECEVISVPKDEEWEENLETLRWFYLNKFVPFLSGMNK